VDRCEDEKELQLFADEAGLLTTQPPMGPFPAVVATPSAPDLAVIVAANEAAAVVREASNVAAGVVDADRDGVCPVCYELTERWALDAECCKSPVCAVWFLFLCNWDGSWWWGKSLCVCVCRIVESGSLMWRWPRTSTSGNAQLAIFRILLITYSRITKR
jgi:hypothetical protein